MTASKTQHRLRNTSRSQIVRRAVLTAVAGLAGVAAPADAGSFKVSQCNDVEVQGWLPGGFHSSVWGGWGGDSYIRDCGGNGDALKVWYPNRRLATGAHASYGIHVPASMPGTSIAKVQVAYEAFQTSAGEAAFRAVAGGSLLFARDLTGGPAVGNGDLYSTPAGSRNVEFSTLCSPANQQSHCWWNQDTYHLKGVTLRLEESVRPTANASGALLSGGRQAGTRALDVTATDGDSGVKKVEITLGGVRVGSFDFAASCKHDRFAPCDQSVLQQIDVDTTKVPDGSRLLRVVATDLAGNSKSEDKGNITVENAPAASNTPPTVTVQQPKAAAPQPSTGATTNVTSTTSTMNNDTTYTTSNNAFGTVPNGSNHSVKAIMRMEGSSTRSVRYGKPTMLKGKLLNENGRAIVGAAITVSERAFIPRVGFAEGSSMTPVGTIVTRADGAFAYTAKVGASRTVQFGYKAFEDAGEFARTTDVTLLVSGKTTLKSNKRAVRNGQSVRFLGTVATPAPASGVQIDLQARTSRGWMTFKTTRASSTGKYNAGYKFTATRGTQVYQFRAKAKADSHYGFKAATAKTIRVRVSGR